MRKVLLATTALVAMSVTAAHADISISGNYEWEYTHTMILVTAWGDDGTRQHQSHKCSRQRHDIYCCERNH